jgi:hypothetical protein
MRLTDTKIVKEEYTLEALHDAFKTQFHEYLSNVFVYEDPFYYIMDFRNKYIYTDINKLQNKFRAPKDYWNNKMVLKDIMDAVLLKPEYINPLHINEMLKKNNKLWKQLSNIFNIAIANAEMDLEKQRLMKQYGICGKNKEYLECLYEIFRRAMKKCTIKENSVTRCVFDLIPNADEVIRDIIRLVFTSYIRNPMGGRNILAAHLITRLNDGNYNYAQHFDCWSDIRCALCVHQLSRNTDFDKMVDIILDDDSNVSDGFGWEEYVFKNYDENTYNFIDHLTHIMYDYITEKDVERYKRNARKNMKNKITGDKF